MTTISGKVIGSERVIQNILNARALFQERVTSIMSRILIDLRNHVISDKLSGQQLHVRSGRLRNSINWKLWSEGNGDTIKGSVGTGVAYAAIHEYGFVGPEQVRAHLRTISRNARGEIVSQYIESTTVNSQGNTIIRRRKRKVASQSESQVQAYTRTMHMPERSYLRSSLQDQRDSIIRDLNGAIADVVRRINNGSRR